MFCFVSLASKGDNRLSRPQTATIPVHGLPKCTQSNSSTRWIRKQIQLYWAKDEEGARGYGGHPGWSCGQYYENVQRQRVGMLWSVNKLIGTATRDILSLFIDGRQLKRAAWDLGKATPSLNHAGAPGLLAARLSINIFSRDRWDRLLVGYLIFFRRSLDGTIVFLVRLQTFSRDWCICSNALIHLHTLYQPALLQFLQNFPLIIWT